MYEETKSSIDWKGLFLKVVIAFLIVMIAVKGYSTLKSNNTTKTTTTEATAESKSSSTFTENIEKLKTAGEKYFTDNKDKMPKTEGTTSMVTLNELINGGFITNLSDEDGKTCDGESSYVTAILEGSKTKIKANLVCGSASSYSLVYMGENDNNTSETTNTTSSNTSNSKTDSVSYSKSSSNTCTSSSCKASEVKISNTVSQKVTINGNSNTKSSNNNNSSKNNTNSNSNNNSSYSKKSYTVSFNTNGGYPSSYKYQTVRENNTAYDPGSVSKDCYTFNGWYLNGRKYDFSTPVTQNITLVAKFTRNNYCYDDYDDDNRYDDRYDDNYRGQLRTGTYISKVYTMGWDTYGSDFIDIEHQIKVPSYLKNKDIESIKIDDIDFYQSINTQSLAKEYRTNHRNTFFYEKNGWESNVNSTSSLATITSRAVNFDYDEDGYVDFDEALSNGFRVRWYTTYVNKQCRTPFTVNGETNKCNYGIVYKVTWKYRYYR